MKHQIREIDPKNQQDVATITRLHLELLPQGPMARLGELFLQKFCYTVLLCDGLIRAALYEVDGQSAGFIAYTDRSITFHRFAIKKHWGYVAYLMALSIARAPHLMSRLLSAVWLMFSRRKENRLGKDPSAEILAIGVRPEYTRPEFMWQAKVKVSEDLVMHASSYFQRVGLKKMRMIVDADNTPALLFYHSLGARFEPHRQAGKPVFLAWLDLESEF